METTEPTKICRACAEEIKAAAKLCPFCQTSQDKFVRWQLEFSTAHVRAYQYVLPEAESAFRLAITPAATQERYATQHLTLTTARTGRAPF